MLAVTFAYHWPLWELQHKAVFDGLNKTITIGLEITEIDVQTELYSDWKEWAALHDHLKWPAAMRAIGGDPTSGGDFAGSTFFTTNGWRIVLDHGVVFTGNLFSDDFASPFIVLPGIELAQSKFSNIVDRPGSNSLELADAVWDEATSDHTIAGSFGDEMEKDVPGAVWDAARASHTTVGTFGEGTPLLASDITLVVAGVWAKVVDGTITAEVALQYVLAMAAGGFTEAVVSGTIKDFTFQDRAGSPLFTGRIETAVGRSRTLG